MSGRVRGNRVADVPNNYLERRPPLNPATLAAAPDHIRLAGDVPAPDTLQLHCEWDGSICRASLTNTGSSPEHIQEVILFDIRHDLPPETKLYAESFQMLSQTAGTLFEPKDLSGLTDRGHYRIPEPPDARAVYGLLTLSPPDGDTLLLGFTSCRRFVGKFYLRHGSLQVAADTEGLTLEPGETWALEEFMCTTGPDRNALLEAFAEAIGRNHPPIHLAKVPTGWCSWYGFGPDITADQVREHLDLIAERIPDLEYVQIDDGYQAAMGDWLETGGAFGGDARGVLRQIKERGFRPALWVAPFIAEADSNLFREHPDWFIKDDAGDPLPSDRVTFGGWRRGPWYALDGTHPDAQAHLERLFHTLRTEWDVEYFKLDANFWGAMHGGRFHDPDATRVEAYRRGMEAVRRGAGDAFLLGCNHPLWPSLGLIHGSRSSNDIGRSWESFRGTARENLYRNWQNGRLWWSDPDCLLLTGDLTEDEFQFHATALLASGGMILSGDDLTKLRPDRWEMLSKLATPSGIAATFTDETFQTGEIALPEGNIILLFNWGDDPLSLTAPLDGPCRVTDFWTGEALGEHSVVIEAVMLPPHSARALVCTPP